MSTLSANTVYDHELLDIDGEQTSLSAHKGKVLLLVNVASRCGFTQNNTSKNFINLTRTKALWFVDSLQSVCGQEPDRSLKLEFCSSKFGVTFPMFSKIEVNGPTGTPL